MGGKLSPEFESIFVRLRAMLERNAGGFVIKDDSPESYCLEGKAGPAAIRAWKGEIRSPTMPVAWIKARKGYVSYHLMGLYTNATLCRRMSKDLKARMHGKTCFNFKTPNEALFKEMEQITAEGIAAFKKAGYVLEPESTAARR